jgi:hypothetical protein
MALISSTGSGCFINKNEQKLFMQVAIIIDFFTDSVLSECQVVRTSPTLVSRLG